MNDSSCNIEGRTNIESIIEAIRLHFDIGSENTLWYRGHSNIDYKLIPGILRQGENYNHVKIDEYALIRDFKLRFPSESNSHKSIIDWLTLMQHYGIPTRLLDWTENLFKGLFFAVSSDFNIDGSLHVYKADSVIEPNGLTELDDFIAEIKGYLAIAQNMEHFINLPEIKKLLSESKWNFKIDENGKYKLVNDKGEDRTVYLELPVSIKPKLLNERLKMQQGVFTLHGGKFVNGELVSNYINIGAFALDRMWKITIPKESKKNILFELKNFGIDESSLFPEMSEQANYLKQKYTT